MDANVFIVFGAITVIVLGIAYFRYSERMQLINRGINPHGPKVPHVQLGSKALFTGLVVLAVGLAVIVSSILLWDYNGGIVFFAALCLFTGGASLLYWKLTSGEREYARKVVEQFVQGK